MAVSGPFFILCMAYDTVIRLYRHGVLKGGPAYFVSYRIVSWDDMRYV